MPLLDAALAFSLTMLAVASLSTQILAWLDQWRDVRSTKLKQMLLDFVTRRAYQAVRRAEGYASDQGERIQTELVGKLRDFEESPQRAATIDAMRETIGEKTLADLDAEAKRWVHAMGIADLVERVDVEKEVSIGGQEILERIQKSEFFREIQSDASDKVDAVLDELVDQWKQLEQRYVAAFRHRAQLVNTAICLVLAVALNIDALHVLDIYMDDETSRSAVVAQQAAISEGASVETPPTAAELRQEAKAFEESAFPVGWDQFPNCPPNSVDVRCLAYWQRAVGDLDLRGLDYAERLAINPARYPLTAVWGRVADQGSNEDAGLARARMAAQKELGGHLPLLAVLGWLGGCLLTALLAGLGSPFWFEIVRRLATARENMRKTSLETVGHVGAHPNVTPSRPSRTKPPTTTPAGATPPEN